MGSPVQPPRPTAQREGVIACGCGYRLVSGIRGDVSISSFSSGKRETPASLLGLGAFHERTGMIALRPDDTRQRTARVFSRFQAVEDGAEVIVRTPFQFLPRPL